MGIWLLEEIFTHFQCCFLGCQERITSEFEDFSVHYKPSFNDYTRGPDEVRPNKKKDEVQMNQVGI